MSPQGQKMSDMPILVGSSGPHQYIKTCPPSHTHTHSSFMSHVLHYCDSGSHRKNLHQFPHKSTPLPQLPFSQVCVCVLFHRGYSTPTHARRVAALPSCPALCAMAARCLCSGTASRTHSKPSSAQHATRTAFNRVPAAPMKCLHTSLSIHPPSSRHVKNCTRKKHKKTTDTHPSWWDC